MADDSNSTSPPSVRSPQRVSAVAPPRTSVVAPPRTSVEPPAPPSSRAPASVRRPGRKVVLVVEDDGATRALLARALESRYDVYEAPDGMAASNLLSEMPVPDLLLCDVMMPHVDGFTFAKTLRADEALKALPIIFLTARASPTDVVKGIQIGAKHYVQKPFNVTDLLEKVARILDATAVT